MKKLMHSRPFIATFLTVICVVSLLSLTPQDADAQRGGGGVTAWTRLLGSPSADYGDDIAIDASGNSFVTGYTGGDLAGTGNLGGNDVFVAKYDSTGVQQWATQAGTVDFDRGKAIALDNIGNVYVTGYTAGNFAGTNLGSMDVWVAKFDTLGNPIMSFQFGTENSDIGSGIAVDINGNIYLCGQTGGDLGQPNQGGDADLFLAKFDAIGNSIWIRQLGTSAVSGDKCHDLALADGYLYFAGYTGGTLASGGLGGGDILVGKYDTNGNQIWLSQAGSAQADAAFSIAVDNSGNSYLTGYTDGGLTIANLGWRDTFVMKFDALGHPLWADQFGTSGWEEGFGIAVDGSGNSYTAGYTTGNLGAASAGGRDVFMAKYDTNGSSLSLKQYGSADYDTGTGISVTDTGSDYFLTGFTYGSLGGNTNAGNYDAFIARNKP